MKQSPRWLASNGVTPCPVYEGIFEDGRLRMSVWQHKGKPLDFDRPRRIVAGAIKDRFGREMIDGFLHHRSNGLAVTTRDPLFSGEQTKKARKPAAKAVLRDLIAWLDGEHDNDAILALAREIAA